MPNWCFNSLEIIGNKSDLDEIAKRVNDANSFLKGLYPMLNDDGSSMDYNYDHWVKVYGTKWEDDLSGPAVVSNDLSGRLKLDVCFQTAWSPPLEGLFAISQLWPSCVFGITYTEPGMSFAGFEIVYNGIVDVEHSLDYPDFGDWETDPDGCCDRQNEFEESVHDALTEEMSNYNSVVKVTKLGKS